MYPTIDFKSLQGYPTCFDTKWLSNPPIFWGLPTPYIVIFLDYMSEIELGGEDVLIKLFILSLPSFLKYWFKGCCEDRGISSFVHLISRFIDFTKPHSQMYEDALQNLTISLEDKEFTTEIVEDIGDVYHAQYQEPSYMKEDIYEENCQPLEEEHDLSHDSIECSETREVNYQNETLMISPPSNEALQYPIAPTHEEVSKVSYFPFQIFKDSLSYDVESGEVLDFLNPSCYDEKDDFVDNINEFIHIGKRKWDVIGYDGDPIYDIEGHSQKFPLPLSREVNKKFDIWQQEHDMITNFIQTPKDDLMLCSPNNLCSYLEDFDDYSSEHAVYRWESQLVGGSLLAILATLACSQVYHTI
jgi:hypothetical protein